MKLRLALKHSSKNIPSARPKGIKVRLRAFGATTAKAENRILARTASLPPSVVAKSLALKSDGRANNGQHFKDNPITSDEQKRRRAMRKFYGRHMPVPQCSTCAFSTNCPQFKADFECAFLPFLNSHTVGSVEELMTAMENTVEANTQRLHLATIFERLSGAAPSAELSESYAMQFQQLQQLYELKKNGGLRAPEQKNSTIVQLFGNVQMLVNTTAQHHKDIADAPIDIPIETDSGHQLTLTEGDKPGLVPNELMEDFSAASRDSADERPSTPRSAGRPMTAVSTGTLTRK